MKILVSGFEPFGGSRVNPTEQLIFDLQSLSFSGVEIRTVLLPVVFDKCARLLMEEIRSFQPDAVLACGVAGGRADITPERIAINMKDIAEDAPYPDNAGVRPHEQPIEEDGPDGLFTTLPVSRMVKTMREAGIPASISYSAGTYICNNTMYVLLNEIKKTAKAMLGGFIHFPASPEMAAAKPGMPSMSQESMLRGLKLMIEVTIEELRALEHHPQRQGGSCSM
ncbi:pyroglutamyl-peptidase I [Paenibacillus sp. F411]|uniref:pyroglutamyl-peptidase I n=1 Tax=Paenibacillus sp. F411 TaxID=2820239 RepID=UPI001AAEBF9A|nr:pyroglutamyl-peptidase I [Paenibacillus sp. F411]MBO2942833.1 pyroglutamyl-peptidase I [Paenibacillus sp. F411]